MRSCDRSSVVRVRPGTIPPWIMEEYFKLPPPEDVRQHLERVLQEFTEGRDVIPFLSMRDVRQ
jgi:hypothetical protein